MLKQLKTSILMVVVSLVLLCGLYPLVITGVARALFPRQAAGSLVERGGQVIGSDLIGQNFTAPGYFHPRPSAAGNGYDPTASGGTNLGPTSQKLIQGVHKKLPDGKDDPGNFDGITDLAAAYRKENGLAANAPVPADAVTRSASGLDPHVSPANAALQAPRVARARGLSEEQVRQLIAANTEPPTLGVLGEARVNVLRLNLAVDEAGKR
jgi:K+-transporting ATPase ATPase C chain